MASKCEMEIDRVLDADPAAWRGSNLDAAFVGVVDRHGSRESKRSGWTENGEKTGDAAGVRNIGRRKHAPVHDRHVSMRHLPPLPRHAFPKAPVVIVITGRVLELNRLALHVDCPAHAP